MVLCNLCDHLIRYGNRGLPAITDHIKTKTRKRSLFDLKKVIVRLTTPQIIGSSDPDKAEGLYGLSAVYLGQQHERQRNQSSIVHLRDRVANFEAMLVAFIAEENLSFTISGKK